MSVPASGRKIHPGSGLHGITQPRRRHNGTERMTRTESDAGQPVDGARTFRVTGQQYDDFMGRYSRQLAPVFAQAAGVSAGMSALDLGCGPGALTTVLSARLGAVSVRACDPSPQFVQECGRRHPGVEVLRGHAEAIPFPDSDFDVVLAQLVMHFVSDPDAAGAEILRVLQPGGIVAACVWDSAQEMQMLEHFWDAALSVDAQAPVRARTLKFGDEGKMVRSFEASGFEDLTESTLAVNSTYEDFEELWTGFMAGIGPAGAYCRSLPADVLAEVREVMFGSLSSPAGPFTLSAVARCAFGRAPR